MTDASSRQSRFRAGGPSRDSAATTGPDPAQEESPVTGSAGLRIAIVGPAGQDEPAAHTTMLAHQLRDAGHDVTLVSWVRPAGWPDAAGAAAAAAVPLVAPFPRTIRALRRARPHDWVRAGRRLQAADVVVVVHVGPGSLPFLVALLRAAGAVSDGPGPRPRSVVVCLGQLPHGGHPLGQRLVSALLSRADAVLVHDDGQVPLARALGALRVTVADRPSGSAEQLVPARRSHPSPTRLLALGRGDEAEGVGLLLRAMASVPDVTLTIAGDLGGAERQLVGQLAADPALTGRVELREGAVPPDLLAGLLADHDALALPFRPAPGARDVLLALDVPPFSRQVTDGVDGLLVPGQHEEAFAAALRRLGEPEVRRSLADGVQAPDLSGPWASYLGAIEALSVDEGILLGDAAEAHAGAAVEPGDGPEHADSRPCSRSHAQLEAQRAWRRSLAGARRAIGSGLRGTAERAGHAAAARAAAGTGSRAAIRSTGRARRSLSRAVGIRRPLVTLQPYDLPDWVLVTDVLGEPQQADDSRRLSRILGLPRSLDSVSAWAALGTLAAILRVRDDGRRSAVIVDEGASRSLLSRWARAVGFAPVEIHFTGERPSVAALDVDAGSLDVVVRIHPQGCDGDDVDLVMEQASWALGSGGLLIVTVPIGPRAAEGALGPADVRAVLARADSLGFVLVGDLDGDVNARMRDAASRARADDAAYGLVRLTLRRR